MISKQQKADVKARPAIRQKGQQILNEVYTYFDTVHGEQPSHKKVVKLISELLEELGG